ncbi:hypothetical protein [Permianibacter aggregans]|uniref:Patatin-like phospholipase n=1 Tax=Permianibacter aggregans TaxID=1510150 RepID=A0A4R6UW46_9GAMM|nr:hypothetical protein [Permianibacter aggregans]QGX38703.1 hypothetical protein E2H98_03120 [Permianibacter aggregans]TDQ50496.1 patatin-like phospholipase [Permianibacter aggregans]
MNAADKSGSNTTFDEVKKAEQQWLQQRRQAAQIDPQQAKIGLAVSGGGIRSACFHLGILQGLIARDSMKQVDYFSSVSGGGYIASCWQWLSQQSRPGLRDPFAEPQETGHTVLDWLRAHGKYLIDGHRVTGFTLGASILAGALFNLLVILPSLLLLFWLMSLPLFPLDWPHWLSLPGAATLKAHSGFLMLFAISGLSLVLYLLLVPLMALWRDQRHGLSVHRAFRQRMLMGRLLSISLLSFFIALIPVLARLEDTIATFIGKETWQSVLPHINYLLPMLAGAFTATRRSLSPQTAYIGITLLVFGLCAFAYHVVAHTAFIDEPYYWAWFGLSLILLAVAHINIVSMHSYYLHQLRRAFFPFTTSIKPRDPDLPLREFRAEQGAAYPLVNTTVNTRNSNDRLQSERCGASFTLSPLYCGAPQTGYLETVQFNGGNTTLGQAMTTSGAAVDPDSRFTSNRAISFLMTLLNARLGCWVRHRPGHRHIPYAVIVRELLAVGLRERSSLLHLSDGGHFENLGVYELIRRRCPCILVGDAGADPDLQFSDLGNLIQLAAADFSTEINLCVEALKHSPESRGPCFAVGEIRYPDGSSGMLVYVKSLLPENATADLTAFAASDPAFPNDSTADQFFGEQHFDAYRRLGQQCLQQVFDRYQATNLAELFEKAKPATN